MITEKKKKKIIRPEANLLRIYIYIYGRIVAKIILYDGY